MGSLSAATGNTGQRQAGVEKCGCGKQVVRRSTASGRPTLSGSGRLRSARTDIASRRSIRVLQGNVGALFDVDWSPDGTHLVSGGSDKLVTISEAIDGTSSHVLRGQCCSDWWDTRGRWSHCGAVQMGRN